MPSKRRRTILKRELLIDIFNVLDAVSEDDYNALSYQAQGNLIVLAVNYLSAIGERNPRRVFSNRSKFWSMP